MPSSNFNKKIDKIFYNYDNIVISGWRWFFIDLVKKHKSQILKELVFKDQIQNIAKNIIKKFYNFHLIGLHIRQTDYISWENGNYFYSLDEYLSFIPKIKFQNNKKKLILIFSDSKISTIKNNSNFVLVNKLIPDSINKIEKDMIEILMLSMCDDIIAVPSTFSSIGSFFSKKKQNIYILPARNSINPKLEIWNNDIFDYHRHMINLKKWE